jgi:hypothetical protein
MTAPATWVEAKFWGAIRKQIPSDWFVRRIEDASGNLGTFDTYLAHATYGQGWLELKVGGPNEKPDLRKGQPAFAHGLVQAGVPCGYLVGSMNGEVRLIGPMTIGEDWRHHLIRRWPRLDVPAVLDDLFNRNALRRVG